MDREIEQRFAEMGIQDPAGTYSLDASFALLEYELNKLLDDSPVPQLSYNSSITSPSVEERFNYYHKVCENIREAKNKFEISCMKIDAKIQEMMEQLVLSIKARDRELKHKLWCLKTEKMSNWDRQLRACEDAMKELRGECSTSCAIGPAYSRIPFSTQLDFMDCVELKFEAENYNLLLKEIENFGTITVPKESRWTELDVCGRTIAPKFIFGRSGQGAGEFCRPWGVCSDSLGRILVCDRSNHRIQIFDKFGQFLTEFGSEGSDAGEFNRPSGIDVDREGRIVVADKDNHRVQVFKPNGGFLFLFGSQGSRPSQFLYPWDVATNAQCCIAVSDSKNHRVQFFSNCGQLLSVFDASVMRIENPRLMLKFLDSPRGLAFRPDGALLVTDFNNHRILLIHPDFTGVSTFGSEGMNAGEFYRPQGIACDSTGRVAVSDSKNYRIQVFDEQGNVLSTFGSQGRLPGQFDCPQGICFHPNNSIVVVDFSNNRIQVF